MCLKVGNDIAIAGCRHPSADDQGLFMAADPITGTSFRIVRCLACGLVRTEPQPDKSELERFYLSVYCRAGRRYRFGLDRTVRALYGARIRRIERLAGGAGAVLDVGCGPGWLLDRLRERGWRTRGTERSAEAAQYARDVLHLDVRAEDIEDVAKDGGTYDAVIIWHVAEHLPRPADVLREVADLLRPGGVLVVAVPNFGSPEARVARSHWFHLDVPRHLFHFTPATLTSLLAECGFATRRVVYLAPEYDVFSFVQTGLNMFGLPPNLLYGLLRPDDGHPGRRDAGPVASTLSFVLALPLALIGLIWTPFAAAIRRGATVTVYAQKLP
jgi:SAM-dependent methyltransferase